MGSEVRPTQASTHHCSQRRWEPGLLLSLGYPVGLVPSYGAGAWKEVTDTVKSHYNKVRKEQGKHTHCNRDRIHRGPVPLYLNSCTGKANKTTLEVLFSRCYYQCGLYGPLKIWHERARGTAARARCHKEALILTRVALLPFRVLRRLNFNTEGLFIYKLWQLTNCFIRKSFMCLLW